MSATGLLDDRGNLPQDQQVLDVAPVEPVVKPKKPSVDPVIKIDRTTTNKFLGDLGLRVNWDDPKISAMFGAGISQNLRSYLDDRYAKSGSIKTTAPAEEPMVDVDIDKLRQDILRDDPQLAQELDISEDVSVPPEEKEDIDVQVETKEDAPTQEPLDGAQCEDADADIDAAL